jgi:hypothetical protein
MQMIRCPCFNFEVPPLNLVATSFFCLSQTMREVFASGSTVVPSEEANSE